MPITTLVSYSIERVKVLAADGTVDRELMPELTPEQIRHLYEHMVLTRQLDERMFKLQRQGRLGTFARVAGQEGAHVGAAFALRPQDWLVPAFRETGALLLRGIPMEQLLQFWGGDERGSAFPARLRTLPISVPVGTHMLHAVGIAWAMRQSQEPSAVLTVFGEGATSEGDFSEAMNMAAVFQVPVVFFCQNNQYAISCHLSKQTAAPSIAVKALGYGIAGIQVDGNDFFAVYAAAAAAAEHARAGNGPVLIEAVTYRLGAHTTSDDPGRYRSAEEEARWAEREPVKRLRAHLADRGLWRAEDEEALVAQFRKDIDAQFLAQENEPYPLEDVFVHHYAEMPDDLKHQLVAYQKFENWKESHR